MNTDYNSFLASIKKVKEKRVHKIGNSYGIKDTFKDYINKYNISKSTYIEIIKTINKELAKDISNGIEVKFPHFMGALEIRKNAKKFTILENKVVNNLVINWGETIKLWYEDEDARNKKTLIKSETDYIYKIHYNRIVAKFVNKNFYYFKVNRKVKLALKDNINKGTIEAFNLK